MRATTPTMGIIGLVVIGLSVVAAADDVDRIDIKTLAGMSFPAEDSLDVGDEPSADARECLQGLSWNAAKFTVTCQPSPGRDRGDVLIRFPSPVDSGVDQNDLVAMEWYIARDEENRPTTARAVIVVHESGSAMPVGRLFAQGLRLHGLHTFLLHLPFYGERREGSKRPDNANFVSMMRQAIADVRRARDAVTVLPMVDKSHVALQGTSLGGFVSATTACLDRAYDSVFVVLAGGELYDLIQNGKKDAAKVRERLAKIGLEGEKLRAVTRTIEPTRVAHRLDPNRTWLFTGMYDTVVPPKNALALAKAANLDETHHLQLLANHYSGIVFMPFVLSHISQQIASLDVEADANDL